MPALDVTVGWVGSLAWLVAVAVAALLVSLLLTDRAHLTHTEYVGALAVVTGALTAGYLWWAGIPAGSFLTARWGWGLLAGLAAGGLMSLGVTRMPATMPAEHGVRLAETLTWQGVVYGAAEAVLLSALPALIAWEWADEAEWGYAARFVAAMLASIAVIVAHHLGYPEFRDARMALPVVACGLLTVAFLLTGNVLAPVVGHILIHVAAVLRRTELPPERHPVAAA